MGLKNLISTTNGNAYLSPVRKGIAHMRVFRKADPFCRLRVPKYQKAFEAFFFASLLALYYGVLIERDPFHFTGMEAALIVFFIAFAVNEISAVRDAGTAFYAADFWSLWDLCIILIAIAFLICRTYFLPRKPYCYTRAYQCSQELLAWLRTAMQLLILLLIYCLLRHYY